MNYTTQMDAARKGIFTEEMQRVCEYENIRKEERGRRKEKSGNVEDKALKELEAMEKKEGKSKLHGD
mgnify:CR=1 FL=1